MSFNNPLHVNATEHQFEMMVEGQKAFINYQQKGNIINLIHTEVPPELQGRGVASALVEKTLAYIEDNHLKMIPSCSYVQHYVEEHPEWNKLTVENVE